MSEQPNVFILSVDSLPYSSFRGASEQIASIVDGVNFTHAIAPASFTSSSMPAIATGSLTDQIPAWGLPESGEPTPLAEELQHSQYDCALWTDNYLFGSTYNYDRGFSGGNLGRPGIKKRAANFVRETPLDAVFGVFESMYFGLVEPLLSVAGNESSFYRHAEQLNNLALDWLNSLGHESACLCWIHYMDTHHPYQPPESYLHERDFNRERKRSELGEFTRTAIKSNGEGLSEADMEDLQLAFDACCHYISDALQEFIEILQQRGHYNPAKDVLVITADHGEVLDNSKCQMLGHVPPAFWEDIVRVPLIIGHPRWSNETRDDQVSLLDLKRIVLDAVGISTECLLPKNLSRSVVPFVSEWEEPHNGSITTYRGIRRYDGKKVFGAKRGGRNRLLATEVTADESEQIKADLPSDGYGDLPEWGDELLTQLSTFGDAIEEDATSDQVRTKVDEQHLQDLGYIE